MLLNLASAQKDLGCEPIVGVIRNEHLPHIEVAEEARKRGLQVEIFNCSGRFDRKPLAAIRDFLRAANVSLAHGHGYKSDFYGYFSTKPLGLPFIATCHLWTGASPTIRLYEYLDSLILRRTERVVGVSDAIAHRLRDSGIPRSKISVIYNGTDLPETRNFQSTLRQELGVGDRVIVGTVGRLEEQKGLEYFIMAAKEVLAEFPEVIFVVAGEGTLRHRLERMISALGLASSVLLLGRRTDMAGVYASIDLFVLASIDEGMIMMIL